MADLYLINDDEPSQFAARKLSILSDTVRIGDKPGLVVAIKPPIEHAAGGPLQEAILIMRHADGTMDDLRQGILEGPASVFVCRFQGTPEELPGDVVAENVSITFWGRVGTSPNLGK